MQSHLSFEDIQQINARRKPNYKAPSKALHYTGVALAIAFGVAFFGWVGHQDMVIAQIETMSNVCEQSYHARSGVLEEKCGDLIDQVQAEGFEVLSNNGSFWAESK